jgi:hypothetical protein
VVAPVDGMERLQLLLIMLIHEAKFIITAEEV